MADQENLRRSPCPHCGDLHTEKTSFCPSTGRPIADDHQICRNCGAHVKAEANFCPSCGSHISTRPCHDDKKPVNRSPKIWFRLFVSIALVSVVILLLVLFAPTIIDGGNGDTVYEKLPVTEDTTLQHPAGFHIFVPKYTIYEETYIEIKLAEDFPGGIELPSPVWEVSVGEESLNRPVILGIPYDRDLIEEGVSEDEIFAIYWDGVTWIRVQGETDTERQILFVETNHLSFWSWLWDSQDPGEGKDIKPEIVGADIPELVFADQDFEIHFTGRNAGEDDHVGQGYFQFRFLEPELEPVISTSIQDWDGADGLLGTTLYTSVPYPSNLDIPGRNQLDEVCNIESGVFEPVAMGFDTPGKRTIELSLILEDESGSEVARDVASYDILVVNIESVSGDVEVEGQLYTVNTLEEGIGTYTYVVWDESGELVSDETLRQKAIFTASIQQQMQEANLLHFNYVEMMGSMNNAVMYIQDPLGYVLLEPWKLVFGGLKGIGEKNPWKTVTKSLMYDLAKDAIVAVIMEIAGHPKGTSKDIAQAFYGEVMERLNWNIDLIEEVQASSLLNYEDARSYMGNDYFIGVYGKAADNLIDNTILYSYEGDSFQNEMMDVIKSESMEKYLDLLDADAIRHDPIAEDIVASGYFVVEEVWFLYKYVPLLREIYLGLEAYPPYQLFSQQEQDGWRRTQSLHEAFLRHHNLSLNELLGSFELMGIVNWREVTDDMEFRIKYSNLETFKQDLIYSYMTGDYNLRKDLISDRITVGYYGHPQRVTKEEYFAKQEEWDIELLPSICEIFFLIEEASHVLNSSLGGTPDVILGSINCFDGYGVTILAVVENDGRYWLNDEVGVPCTDIEYGLGITCNEFREGFQTKELVESTELFNGNGEIIIVVNAGHENNGAIYLLDLSSGQTKSIHPGGWTTEVIKDVEWVPNRDQIFIATHVANYLYSIGESSEPELTDSARPDRGTTEVDEYNLEQFQLFEPYTLGEDDILHYYSWGGGILSPSGSYMVFETWQDQLQCPKLHIANMSTMYARYLTMCATDISSGWLPDDEQFLFTTRGSYDFGYQIWIANTMGGEPVLLAENNSESLWEAVSSWRSDDNISECGNANYRIGDDVFVFGWVYETPLASSVIADPGPGAIEWIPFAGEWITILDGPVCKDNMIWWFIEFSGGQGWLQWN